MKCKVCGIVRNERDTKLERTRCRACGARYPADVVVDAAPVAEAAPKPKAKKKTTVKKGSKK